MKSVVKLADLLASSDASISTGIFMKAILRETSSWRAGAFHSWAMPTLFRLVGTPIIKGSAIGCP